MKERIFVLALALCFSMSVIQAQEVGHTQAFNPTQNARLCSAENGLTSVPADVLKAIKEAAKISNPHESSTKALEIARQPGSGLKVATVITDGPTITDLLIVAASEPKCSVYFMHFSSERHFKFSPWSSRDMTAQEDPHHSSVYFYGNDRSRSPCIIWVSRDGSGIVIISIAPGSNPLYADQQETRISKGDRGVEIVKTCTKRDPLKDGPPLKCGRDIFLDYYDGAAKNLPPEIQAFFWGEYGIGQKP